MKRCLGSSSLGRASREAMIPTVTTGEEMVELPKVTWRWIIHDFSRTVEEKCGGEAEESPTYTSFGYKMKICLYPAGHSRDSGETVGLFFEITSALNESDESRFKGELALLDPVDMSRKHVARHKHRHPVPSRHGWAKFCLSSKLTQLTQPLDRLAIEASVTIFRSKRSYRDCRWTPKPTLAFDMAKMLESHSSTADVAFELENESTPFKAHRCVLEARAPALFSLADGRVDDDEPCVVVPLSGVDARIFKHVLRFIYTDVEPEDLVECAEDYLKVANVCGAVRLKQLAELHLTKNLDVHNAADFLLLADALDCAHLHEVAAEIITSNISLASSTPGWDNLRRAPHLLAHLLEESGKDATAPTRKRRRVEDLRRLCEQLDLETDGSKQVLERRLERAAAASDDDTLLSQQDNLHRDEEA